MIYAAGPPCGGGGGIGLVPGPSAGFRVGLALALAACLCVASGGDRARAGEAGLAAGPKRVRSWRAEDGLPLGQIEEVAQARDGFLWLAARHEGLSRFDGVRFSPPVDQRQAPRPYPGDKEVSALLASVAGDVWVGTSRGALWRFAGGRWDRIDGRGGNDIGPIDALCEGREGELWIGTEDGLYHLGGMPGRVLSRAQGLSGDPISAIHVDRAGVTWVGTKTGMLYRALEGRFVEVPQPEDEGEDAINAILEGKDGSLWVGTWGLGLARIRGDEVRVFGRDDGLMQPEVLSLAEDRWGSIWAGTRAGLFVLGADSADGRPRVERITEEAAFTLLRDREGTIWAGTLAGLDQYKDWQLRVYSTAAGLAERNVDSICPSREGGLWVGMNGGGVARFRDGAVVATYRVADGLSSDDATSICERRDGSVWVGTWGHGLNRLEGGRFVPVDLGEGSETDAIRSVYEDRAGGLWVGTWGRGLRRLHDGRTTTYTTRDGLAHDQVRVIEEDEKGDLWIATNGGLSRFRDGRIASFTTRDGLTEDSIFALRAGEDGSLWIGTWGGGLDRLRDGRFTAYGARDGLHSDTICEILDDGEGNLWMGSIKGIFRVRTADLDAFDLGTIRSISSVSYGTADGMASAQCNRGTQPSGCRTDEGRLWFATIDGMVMVDPRRLPSDAVPPSAIVERALHDRGADGIAAGSSRPAGLGELEFRYTAATLLSPEKVRFRYKLDGHDDEWTEAGTRREAFYTNVPPGTYTFRVLACNGDGLWGPEGASFRLTLTPPFYRTAWFRWSSLLSSAAAVGLVYRLRVAGMRAREGELVVLVERRTAEARAAQEAAEKANRAKDRFLAVLSHELRTPLTPVLLSVGSLLDQGAEPLAREQLEMIRRNVELEARLVDDLLDVSRIERGSFRLDLERVDVHEAIGRALEVCSAEVASAGLEVVRDLEARAHHALADHARLMQLFWNLIRNATKFTPSGGTLTIRARNEPPGPPGGVPRLVVEFRDTGVGIEPAMLSRIFEPFEQGSEELRGRGSGLGLGLAIGRAVAEAHGGRLSARSDGRGLGSTFLLELDTVPEAVTEAREAPRLETPRGPAGARKILLVEDNADSLRYLDLLLRHGGHEVTPAPNLAAAREAAAAGDHDLLISDIELPDGTGLELMRELGDRGIPGIALSGYGSEDDVHQSHEAGFSAHLIKPVAADVLNRVISQVPASPRPAPAHRIVARTP